MTDRLFVYGTLKRGGRYHSLVAERVVSVREGRVPGLLVDLGGYPGWVPGEGWVDGEVLLLEEPAEVLPRVDALEDYYGPGDPANLYERVLTTVVTPSGEVEAWAYRYVGELER